MHSIHYNKSIPSKCITAKCVQYSDSIDKSNAETYGAQLEVRFRQPLIENVNKYIDVKRRWRSFTWYSIPVNLET